MGRKKGKLNKQKQDISKGNKKTLPRSQWERLVREFKQSSLSRKQFCVLQSVNPSTFKNWLYRVKQQEQKQKGRFIPVSVEATRDLKSATSVELKLQLADQLMLLIPPGFDPQTLKQVVEVLRA